jgi:acetylornithine deacetylase
VAVPRATCRIKFRRSRGLRPEPVLDAVRAAAGRAGVALELASEGEPPELPEDHPLVRLCAELSGKPPATVPFGTDATQLQALAPCVVLGPGDIGVAHTPEERVPVAELAAAVPLLARFLERGAAAA